MLRLAFDFIITWRETRTRPNAYHCSFNRDWKNPERLLGFPLPPLLPVRLLSFSFS